MGMGTWPYSNTGLSGSALCSDNYIVTVPDLGHEGEPGRMGLSGSALCGDIYIVTVLGH